MRVAIYTRVSTADQSTEQQLGALRPFIQARGWMVAKEYSDVISGTTKKRPGLDAMMRDAGRRQFDLVLVWKFDRFARSAQHLLDTLNHFRSLGIQFVSYSENLDTTTPIGAAMFTMVAAMAQLERDLISERTKLSLAHLKSLGKTLGRPVKVFDYDRAMALRSQGKSWRQVARVMSAEQGVKISHVTLSKALSPR